MRLLVNPVPRADLSTKPPEARSGQVRISFFFYVSLLSARAIQKNIFVEEVVFRLNIACKTILNLS